MSQIICIDKYGNKNTFYIREVDRSYQGVVNYSVSTDPLPPSQESFQIAVKEDENGELQVTQMYHNQEPVYSAKGIPEAAILHISKEKGLTVRSSPGKKRGDEFRLAGATKVWDRLVAAGKAKYDPDEDIYRTC